MSEAIKLGDTVEYEDAYTQERRFGRVAAVYGNEFIVRTITREEAGPHPKKFKPRAGCAYDRTPEGTPICRVHRQELQPIAIHGENPPGLGYISAAICPVSNITLFEGAGM